MSYTNTKKIAEINDSLRQTFTGGRVMLTQGVINTLDVVGRGELLQRIKAYDSFDKNNDPYKEHDFGVVIMGNDTFFWKIDYYSLDMKWHSDNPADIEITNRVMTVMCANEY